MEQPSGTAPVCRESGDALTGTSDADRVTLRYGEMELAFERSTVRPRLALAASYHPTRGGARLLDLDPTGCTLSSVPALPARRYTLPYEVPAASVVPFGDYVLSVRPQRSSNPVSSSWYPEVGDRASGVQLRNAKLASEWYELTGTQA